MIKDFRKKYGFSQEELARLTGVSSSTIGYLENNKFTKRSKAKIVVENFIRAYDRRKFLVNEYSKKFHKKGGLLDFFARFWRKA